MGLVILFGLGSGLLLKLFDCLVCLLGGGLVLFLCLICGCWVYLFVCGGLILVCFWIV